MVRNDEGGQAEVVWTCHEEGLKVCRKKGDGNGVTGKRKRGRLKRRFLDVVKENIEKVGSKSNVFLLHFVILLITI